MNLQDETDFYLGVARACVSSGFVPEFRFHPKAPADNFREPLEREGARVGGEKSLAEAIAESDAVIGQCSTALFLAIILRKPLLLIDFPGTDEKYMRDFADVGLRVSTPAQLQAELASPSTLGRRLGAYDEFRRDRIGTENTFENQANVIAQIAASHLSRRAA